MKPAAESLKARSLRAVKWNYIGTFVRVLSQFVAQVGLARLLGPQVMGEFGYALLLSGVLAIVIDQGLGPALIHAGARDERETRIVFWRIVLVSLICTASTFFGAEWLAELMGERHAADVIRAFSPAYLATGAGLVAQAKLRKSLRFREIQIAQNASYLIGYVAVGLGLAFAGAGVWSLVVAWIAQASLAAVIMYRYARHPVAPVNPFRRLEMAKFGRDIVAINAVNWTVDNAMNAYIGKFFGVAPLGLYNMAVSLVKTPADHLVINLQNVLFPTAAEARGNHAGMQKLYLTALSAIAMLAFPAFVFVAVQAREIVDLLLGQKWTGVIPLLAPLSLAMIPRIFSSIAGSVLCGRGDQRIELVSQCLTALAYAACFGLIRDARLEMVCWVFLGIYCLRAVLLTAVVAVRLRIPAGALFSAFQGPILVSAGMMLCVEAFAHIVAGGSPSMSPLATLALTSLVALICAASIVLVIPRFAVPPPLVYLLNAFDGSNSMASTVAGWLKRKVSFGQ